MESYLATGAIPQDAEIISSLHFGARYVTFRDFERFTDQIEDLGLGTLQWPGGTLSEKNIERFGFEYEGLYNSEDTGGKPGIDELMAYTRAHDMNLAVSLPTARYKDDHDLLREHLSGFLDDLYTGHYGELPNTIIFDVALSGQMSGKQLASPSRNNNSNAIQK